MASQLSFGFQLLALASRFNFGAEAGIAALASQPSNPCIRSLL